MSSSATTTEPPNRTVPAATSSATAETPSPSKAMTLPVALDADNLFDSIANFASMQSSASDSNTSSAKANNTAFEPIAFLNHHFQSEAALVSALPTLRSTLSERIANLDSAISSSIQRQTDLADQTLTDLTRAKTAVTHLQQRVLQVKTKASQSEQAVQEITKDMKRLDTAKKNLSKTITALKQLHMLVHALAQLETAIKAKPFPDYATAARLVEATWVLLGHFEAYIRTVDKMKLLKETLDKRREELFRGIVFGFRVVGFNFQTALEKEHNDKTITTSYSSLPMPANTLVDSCLVITALGLPRQRDFVTYFCEDHLEPYEQLFNPKMTTVPTSIPPGATDASKPSLKKKVGDSSSLGDATMTNPNPASLDQIERRFDWYRRMLRELEHKFPSVFPGSWNVHYHMTFAFLSKTRVHYALLFINKEGPELFLRDRDCDNVSILLKAFQKTVLFEKEMTAWLQRDYKTEFLDGTQASSAESKLTSKDTKKSSKANLQDEENVEFDETGKMVVANSVEGMRIKYDRTKKESSKPSSPRAESVQGGPVPRLLGVASIIFDSNMQPYIALEKKSMEELLSKATSDGTVDTRGERPVFTSSTDLFVYIKNSVTRCTALTKGKTFFSLYKAYKDTLKKYAQVIAGKLPISNIPAGEEKTVCHVVDTCEYCADTVEALQDLIQDKIDPEYKEKIDMNGEQEAFHDSSTKAIKLLVSGLLTRVESAYKEMASINWGSMNVVGEESKYVRSIHDTIQPFVISVSGLLPSSYFRNFCDKLASSFITSLYSNISKLKRISESGTQQLLLDIYNLKTLVLRIPTNDISKRNPSSKIAQPSVTSSSTATTVNAPAAYVKMVTTQFQRIEILLKLVGTPLDSVIDVFKAQFVPIGGNVIDLQTVLNLKGMKKPDQTPILEKYGADPSSTAKVAAAATH